MSDILRTARAIASRQVNTVAVLANYEIGRRIVDHEQGGEARAKFGRRLLAALSAELTPEFGRGFSADNLHLFHKFYLTLP